MERMAARGRLAEEAVRFPVDVSGMSEESGRAALEALRRAVAGRRGLEAERAERAGGCNHSAPPFAAAEHNLSESR